MTEHSSEDQCECPGCGNAQSSAFFQTANSPVNCGSLPESRSEAVHAKTAEIELAFCQQCGLVFNRAFDVSLIDFRPGYEVALTHSQVFADFQASVVERLTSAFDLHNKRILEIGCGDGAFLKMICNYGGNHGVGIDPTVPQVGEVEIESGSVQFVRDFFCEKHSDYIGDFICSLSVFEAIPTPGEFLKILRTVIGNRQPGIYFEVFNGFRSIDSGEIWSIHYEQCNYYSLATLETLFRNAGFQVTNSGVCYQGDQYLFVEAVPDPGFEPKNEVPRVTNDGLPPLPSVVREFAENFRQRKQYWEARLVQSKEAGERVVLWGSGGKGISFLNAIPSAVAIEAVVDINPNRQSSFIPGTGHPIVSPEEIACQSPDLIILTNPIYEHEIRAQVAGLGMEAKFDFV